MAKRVVVVAVLICIVTALAAQSPPPLSPTEAAHKKQETSSGINANSDLLKQVTVLLKKQNEYTERQRQKDRDKSASDWWLVIFTGALTFTGVVQLVAMFRQAGYMRRGLSVSIKSARSTRFSAIAAENAVTHAKSATEKTERAFVLIESVVVGNRSSEVSQLESHNLIMFTLKNFGTTIASSVKLSGKLCGNCQWPFPDIPTASIAPQGVFSWVTTQSIGAFIPDDSLRRINSRHAWLEFKIKITYLDAFERGHTYLCEGRYEPALKQFLTISSSSD